MAGMRRTVLATVIGCGLLFGASLAVVPVRPLWWGRLGRPPLESSFSGFRPTWRRDRSETWLAATGAPGPRELVATTLQPLHWPILFAEWAAILCLGIGIIGVRAARERRRWPESGPSALAAAGPARDPGA